VGWENHLTISNEPYIHGDDEPTDFWIPLTMY
jgi:hypothetical protein